MSAALSEVSEPVAGLAGRGADGRVVALPTVAELARLPGVSTAGKVARARARTRWTEHALPQGTERVLPVRRELRALLPDGGLRRGSTVAVRGSTSLLLALLAEATVTGSWAAAVGMPNLGLAAAGEFGVEVGRLALVPRPGADVVPVTAALLDGVDLVAVAPGGMAPSVARRLSARARYRGAVLLALGPWPGAEVELEYEAGPWTGLDAGSGHLRARQAGIRVTRRGSPARLVALGWEAAAADLGQEAASRPVWEGATPPAVRGWGEPAAPDWETIPTPREPAEFSQRGLTAVRDGAPSAAPGWETVPIRRESAECSQRGATAVRAADPVPRDGESATVSPLDPSAADRDWENSSAPRAGVAATVSPLGARTAQESRPDSAWVEEGVG